MTQIFLPDAARSAVSDELAKEAWIIAEALERLEQGKKTCQSPTVRVSDDDAARPCS